jgi:hypothetical protein
MYRQISYAAGLLACIAAPAAAEMKYENANGGHVKLYGQFSPAYLHFDDGIGSFGEIVDNQNSNSRVGLWVVQPGNSGTFKFNFETSLGLRKSSRTDQIFTPDWINWQRTEIRKIDFSYGSNTWGTVYVGQGSVATDGAAHQDLSGTTIALYNGIPDTAGAALLRPVDGVSPSRTVGSAFSDYDGGRRMRVRYDTPEFLPGLKFSAAYGEEVLSQTTDLKTLNAALYYDDKIGAFKMLGALGYARTETGTDTKRSDTIASFSILHDSGVNGTIAAGRRDIDGSYVYGKIGYRAQWFAVGKTNLAFDYYDGKDQTVDGSDSSAYGVVAVQDFDDLGLQAYLAYRSYSLTEISVDYHDASSILFGARWKF